MVLRVDMTRWKRIENLVGGTSFPDRSSLFSMALGLGIFLDRRGTHEKGGSIRVDPSELDIWPMVQLIIHGSHPDVETLEEMSGLIEGYLIGGLDVIAESVQGKVRNDALMALADLLPP